VATSEPFYFPDPDVFAHADAFTAYTTYAAELEDAGLAERFPDEAELRHLAIELLAERHRVEDVIEDPDRIDEAIVFARGILAQRRSE
jgi:hypothetical protein